MKRPLLWAFGFLIAGILIGRAPGLAALSPVLLFGLSLGLGLVFCGILFFVYRYKPVFALMLFLLVGLTRVGDSLHSHVIEPVHVEFHGVVVDVGRTGGGNQRAIVSGENFDFRVMAYILPHQPQVVLGQEVVLTGYLEPLRGPANPAGYNQFQHLRSQKVDATIWPEEITLGDIQISLMVLLRGFRDRLAHVYDSLLPSREAGVIKSMVLGDRLDMDQDLAGQYRMMGIFHILSISGMHVTILTMAAFSVLKKVMAERPAGVVVLVIMIAYCLMTGAAVPTVRAVTMGGVLVLGRILYRDYDLLASVSFAGIALLIFEPLYLFNVGFQLSFGAVFGIGVLRASIERGLALLRLPAGKFRESLSVGISAVVASYLVFAHHLYEIPLYSVLGNIVIMPTVTILLVLGVLVGLVGLVWMGLAGIIAGPVYYILRFYAIASDFFSSLPGAMTLTGGGSLLVTLAGVGVVLAFAFAFSGFGEDFRKRLALFFAAVLILIGCVFIRDFPFDLRITALDTGGNYSVIRHRNEMLIVGSGRGGETTLLGYMDMRGVNRAHGLVLTAQPRPGDMRRLEAVLPRVLVLYLPEGLVLTDALWDAVIRYGLGMVWLYDDHVLEIGRVTLQAESGLGLRVALESSYVIVGEGVVLGGIMYEPEYYSAILLRISRRQIRYWLYREN
ncbi:MAG: ComEC family competence protein [Defluviitaleaceae bacterium]|nr:ComEC family competence protein [Defluviitaleaceae bacterium]